MLYNLYDEQKEHLKIEDNKRKNKCDDLYVDEKEQLRKYEKKGQKTTCEQLNNEKKQHVKIEDSKRKKQNVIILIIVKKNI